MQGKEELGVRAGSPGHHTSEKPLAFCRKHGWLPVPDLSALPALQRAAPLSSEVPWDIFPRGESQVLPRPAQGPLKTSMGLFFQYLDKS